MDQSENKLQIRDQQPWWPPKTDFHLVVSENNEDHLAASYPMDQSGNKLQIRRQRPPKPPSTNFLLDILKNNEDHLCRVTRKNLRKKIYGEIIYEQKSTTKQSMNEKIYGRKNLRKCKIRKVSHFERELNWIWINWYYYLSLIHISEPTRPY